MLSARSPLYAKLTMSAELNYLLSCHHVRPNKPHHVNQQVMNYKLCEAFLIFSLVAEKI